MIIGQSAKPEDIELNVCKTKKLTNTRSSSADEALRLTTPKEMSLEKITADWVKALNYRPPTLIN